jgi:hypothetical protein
LIDLRKLIFMEAFDRYGKSRLEPVGGLFIRIYIGPE